jgi:hypothetical protein
MLDRAQSWNQLPDSAWAPLPPDSCVWNISENRRIAIATESRLTTPGGPLEICTPHGAIIRLSENYELRLGGWRTSNRTQEFRSEPP